MQQTTATGARQALSEIGGATIGYTAVNDAYYEAKGTDRHVSQVNLTATRAVLLPRTDLFPIGETIFVTDGDGRCNGNRRIRVQPWPDNGDYIGDSSPIELMVPFGGMGFRLEAGRHWVVVANTNARRQGYLPIVKDQYVAPAEYGRWFYWELVAGSIGLPQGSEIFPGWWCRIRFGGNPVGPGQHAVVTGGYKEHFVFNSRDHSNTDGTTVYRNFIVIGGGEEFIFTWTGAEYVVETVQSPPPGHFYVKRYGSGGYVVMPTAFELMVAQNMEGTNTQAADYYGIGFKAPCDGLYRLTARGRIFNDVDGSYYAGGFVISGTNPEFYDRYAGWHFRNYQPYDYQDVSLSCVKRMAFGEIAAAYKIATNTNLKTLAGYETFTAELLSRG